jgi:hypothetical protein
VKINIKMLHISLLYTIEEKRGEKWRRWGWGGGRPQPHWRAPPTTSSPPRHIGRRMAPATLTSKKDHFYVKFFQRSIYEINFSKEPNCEKSRTCNPHGREAWVPPEPWVCGAHHPPSPPKLSQVETPKLKWRLTIALAPPNARSIRIHFSLSEFTSLSTPWS